MPVGTALNVTDAVTKDVEARLRNDPRVVDVAASVGSGGGGGGGRIQTNQSQVQVTLKPGTSSNDAGLFVTMWQSGLAGTRARGAGGGGGTVSPERRAQMRKLMGAPIPGLQAFGRTTDIVSRILSQGQNELSIMIYGPDLANARSRRAFGASGALADSRH